MAFLDVPFESYGPLGMIFNLGVFVPTLAVGARRLHDVNKSGWWQLLILTVIGIIPVVVWLATVGDKKNNRFGMAENGIDPGDSNAALKEAIAELNKTKKSNNHEEEAVLPSPSQNDTPGSSQETPFPDETKVFCGKCGKDNSRDSRFCTQCGEPLVL